ncbi:SNF2 family N-terminal domain-containing protein [Armillaria luteobubalina]|uniref:SNF2 family N-terminal domain-containing protein n=1 Tax=Armillaria luteobubalina TaxID=153913 RepID=A0AA39TWQ1_9AGAR|nr:SNF2 family N-terminal domain-containing protein [Armillaria luteobubalina]
MRDTGTSCHSLFLRATGRHYLGDGSFRPALNITHLLRLLTELLAPVPDKGKKRVAQDTLPRSPKFKRRRLMSGSGKENDSQTLAYPFVQRYAPPLEGNTHTPILRHTFEIQYTTNQPAYSLEGHFQDDADWIREEDELRDVLQGLGEHTQQPQALDLGHVLIEKYHHKFIGVSEEYQEDRGEWLFMLPTIEEDDPCSFKTDILELADSLKTHGRVSIDASLRLTELPFRLHVDVTVSILIPRIFDPFGGYKGVTKKTSDSLESTQRQLLHFAYAKPTPSSFQGLVSIPFFYSILGPASSLPSESAIEAVQPEELLPILLPFQRRSVAWLLEREGKAITSSGDIIPKTKRSEYSFWETIEESDESFQFNCLTGQVIPASEITEDCEPVFGGILAEEPGLGKTLEIISLILLNPAAPDRNSAQQIRWDPVARLEVKTIKTTLIVTPPALASQWMDELATHAPTLKVLEYDGWSKVPVPINATQLEEERARRAKTNQKRSKKGRAPEPLDDIVDWCTWVNNFDVVVTTYNVLKTDFNVARAAPVRPRRADVVYSNVERPRSPLVMCEWQRVVMDEVQMVGGGKTEDMVSYIPRLSSFAVSGTPARTQVQDLIHVLKFLRVNNAIGSARLWNRLVQPSYAAELADFFSHYTIRTMKSTLEAELTIPQQTRYLRHVYDQTLEAILQELGLDARGVAASAGWETDGTVLRSSLRRLRGICTHPQVGQLQRQNDKLFKPGALKTIEQVLHTMQDQNWRNVMDDFKSKVQAIVRLAQLKQHDNNDHSRYHRSLELLLAAEKEADGLIDEIELAITDHDAKGDVLKKEAPARRAPQPELPSRKGKERELSWAPSEDTDDDGLPHTPAGEEHGIKRRALQQRLRESRMVLHRVKFLQGDTYHVLGDSFSVEESAAYGESEEMRRNLLKSTEDEANRGMAQLDVDATKHGIDDNTLTIYLPYLEEGGIRSRDIARSTTELSSQVDQLHEIIEDVLNVQSTLLWEWRTHLHKLLTQKLSASENEADGEEYQRSLDDQGEAETYLQAYTALLADHREALVNERTLLAVHDAREKKYRQTRTAVKATVAEAGSASGLPSDIELQPEHEVLHQELTEQRKKLLRELDSRSVKSILVDLTAAMSRITRDSDPEKTLLKEAIADVRRLITDQGALLDKLDADLALFRKAFNQRILYFRQLQEISDSVTQVTWEKTFDEAVEECEAEKARLEDRLKTNRARQRYLDNLAKDRDEAKNIDDECVLCGCEFERGFITACAHVFCEGCMKAWLQHREGKACPVCRVPVDSKNLQRFTVNGPENPAPSRIVNGEMIPHSHRKIEYNMIDPELFDSIEHMECFGDYGRKIQTLVRHLLYLQENDPGSKSIVFSAWEDSLHILQRALTDNAIQCLRIDQGRTKSNNASKRFKSDPDIRVLLLHGQRENAGLNITCASRVFLLESVVHHGFEVQAIARIDRLGQTRPTEVYCYYAEDTVERNILDLAARRGLSLYTKENSAGTLNAASFDIAAGDKDIDSPSKKKHALKGDFISKVDDMLAILFPHMFEDVEFLLSPDEDTRMENGQANAVAGPSKLR